MHICQLSISSRVIRMSLENRMKILLAAGLVGFYGCMTTSTVSQRAPERDTATPLTIGVATLPPGQHDVSQEGDGDARAFKAYRDTYTDSLAVLDDLFSHRELEEAAKMLRTLADKMAADSNPFAQKDAEFLKSYSYTLYEANETVQTDTRKQPSVEGTAGYGLVGLPVHLFGSALSIITCPLTGECKPSLRIKDTVVSTKTDTRVTATTYDKYKVTPYSGAKELVQRGVPYSEIPKEPKTENLK